MTLTSSTRGKSKAHGPVVGIVIPVLGGRGSVGLLAGSLPVGKLQV